MLLPENFGLMGLHAADKLAVQERDGDGPQQDVPRAMARDAPASIVIGGSVPIAAATPARVRQTLLVYGPDGARVARYDKIHLFRFTHGDEDYDEAQHDRRRRRRRRRFDAPCGRVGLSICYDLRFPELYRALGDVALIVVPAAFTARTGEAHWEMLLRARAIENQCYVLAAAQGGTHPGGRRTWGHSMLVGPWGDVLDVRDDGAGVVVGDVDPCGLPTCARSSLRCSIGRSSGPGLPVARGSQLVRLSKRCALSADTNIAIAVRIRASRAIPTRPARSRSP